MSLLLHLFFSFFCSIPAVLSQKLWSLFYFFSSPALSSSSHLSDLSHQPSSLKLSSPCKAKAIAVTSPNPSRRRRQPVAVAVAALCCLKLWSLLFFFHHLKLSSLCVTVAVPAVAVAVASPLQVSALFFSSEFCNCCFGLIFLDLVLFCGEKWCCPYVILGKIKKNICIGIEWLFFFWAMCVIFDSTLCEFFAVFARYNI